MISTIGESNNTMAMLKERIYEKDANKLSYRKIDPT